MSIYEKKQKSRLPFVYSTLIFAAVMIVFDVGRYFAPPAIKENSKEYILAQAQARGEAQAAIRAQAIRDNAIMNDAKKSAEYQRAVAQKEQLIAEQKNKEEAKIKALNLTPIDDFINWKSIDGGWEVRGINFRMDLVTPTGQTKAVLDQSGVLFEYTLRRSDKTRPRLSRILFEVFDDNYEFMFPGVVDISGTDAGLVYVRTGVYDFKGKTPKYCRVTTSEVGLVKYANEYPVKH
jgi:hypothetical protein